MADVVSGVLSGGLNVIARAFFMVIGYYFTKLAVGYIGAAIPQVAALGNIAVVAVGLLVAIFAGSQFGGFIADMGYGAALLGAAQLLDGYVTPVLAGFVK